MDRMRYKLLILDIDGTLVECKEGAKISKKVVDAIRKAKTYITVSLCTGRTHRHCAEIIEELGIGNSYHVIESGTKLLNPQGKLEYSKFLTLDDVKEIVKEAGDAPVDFGFCVDGIWKRKINEINGNDITIVALHSKDKKNTQEILKNIKPLENKFNFHVGTSWFIEKGAIIHVTHHEASKEFGLKYIQKKLNIDQKETIGVGDMPNDLPMFKVSGLKAAMGNADEQLKKVADLILPSLGDDGVAWLIEKYVFASNSY